MRDIYLLHTNEPTADESAEIKQVLKKDPVTPRIRQLGNTHHAEASEACDEVERGLDAAHPESWVAEVLNSV